MTVGNIKDHFVRLLAVHYGKKGSVVEKLVDTAIVAGKDDFWGAYPWAFKENSATVTTTSGTETVDLPDDFEGLLTIREKETSYGRKLVKLSASEYDRLIPYSADRSNNTPAYFKVFYSTDDAIWKLALYPTPSAAISLYINYHVIEENGEIPDKYIGGLKAAIAKHLWMDGSREYWSASNAFTSEVNRLKDQNNPDVEEPTRFLTEMEATQEGDEKWYGTWV